MPGTLRPRAPLHHRSEVWPHGLEAAGRGRLWSGWTETVAAPGPAPRGSGVPAMSLGVQVARRLVQTRGSAGDAKQAPNLTQTRLPAAGGAARPRTCLQGLRRGGGGDVQGCWGVHSGRGHAVSPLSSSHSSWRTAYLWGQSRGTSSLHPRDSCACQAMGHICREGGNQDNTRAWVTPPNPAQQRNSMDPKVKGPLKLLGASLVAQLGKNLPAMWETCIQSLGWEDPLEKGKATHSSILAGEFRGLYSPKGRQESDATERLSLKPQGLMWRLRLRCWPSLPSHGALGMTRTSLFAVSLSPGSDWSVD